MIRSPIYRRLMLVLVLGNTVFWGWFWVYFLVHSNPTVSHPAVWESSPPWAIAFGRAFGNGTSIPEVLKIPTVRAATVLFVPCFVVTWPVSRWLPGDLYFAGADAQGLRLLTITVLSFFQWMIVLRLCFAIRRVLERRQPPTVAPAT
jgi:hypothetical protein